VSAAGFGAYGLSDYLTGTKAFFGSISNSIVGGVTGLVTGEAGRQLGERAFQITVNNNGGKFNGQWGQVAYNVAGQMAGTHSMAEGMMGIDLASHEAVVGADRAERLIGGLGQFAGIAAGPAGMARSAAGAGALTKTTAVGIARPAIRGTASSQLPVINSNFSPKAPLQELLIEQAARRGFATAQDEAIFWSGLGRGNSGVVRSQRFAIENGGRTLEMTPGGRYLQDLDLYGPGSALDRVQADNVWGSASREFARGASGQARAVVGSVRPNSNWRRVELPELNSNPRVNGIDVLQLKPRLEIRSQ